MVTVNYEIVEHDGGWASPVTGLARLDVAVGQLGRAAGGAERHDDVAVAVDRHQRHVVARHLLEHPLRRVRAQDRVSMSVGQSRRRRRR